MKRFVLFLFLVGTAVYLLAPQQERVDDAVASSPPAKTLAHREVSEGLQSSWGSTLQTMRQEPEVVGYSDSQPYSPETTGSLPAPKTDVKEAELAAVSPPSQQLDQQAPAVDDTEGDADEWVRFTQAVTTRSDAALTALPLRSYSAGSKAKVVGRANGWVQLFDPTTQERGWVYHAYLASIGAPSAAQLAAANKPKPVATASAKPRKVVRKKTRTAKPAVRAKKPVKVTKAQRRDRNARRAERKRGGFFKRRKARRARAMTLGPSR